MFYIREAPVEHIQITCYCYYICVRLLHSIHIHIYHINCITYIIVAAHSTKSGRRIIKKKLSYLRMDKHI